MPLGSALLCSALSQQMPPLGGCCKKIITFFKTKHAICDSKQWIDFTYVIDTLKWKQRKYNVLMVIILIYLTDNLAMLVVNLARARIERGGVHGCLTLDPIQGIIVNLLIQNGWRCKLLGLPLFVIHEMQTADLSGLLGQDLGGF